MRLNEVIHGESIEHENCCTRVAAEDTPTFKYQKKEKNQAKVKWEECMWKVGEKNGRMSESFKKGCLKN